MTTNNLETSFASDENISMLLDECKGEKEYGQFYSLQDAYEKKIVSFDFLKKIYNLWDNKTNIIDELEKIIELKIKNDVLYSMRSRINCASIEDVKIIAYYGSCGNAYAVIFSETGVSYMQTIHRDMIGDLWNHVMFEYTDPFIVIWKETINEK